MTKKALEVLERNAKRINDNHAIAIAANAVSEEKGREAIKAAVVAGKNLMACKAMLDHGKWLPWLAENCKGISEKTAQNYMRIANPKRVADLSKCTSLREAYKTTGKTSGKGDASDLCPIKRRVKSLLKTIEEENDVASTIEYLKPLVEWYNEHLPEAFKEHFDKAA